LSQPAQNLAESEGNLIVLAGVPLLADPQGALYWPEQGLLAVADLHLEKGSSFAADNCYRPTIPGARWRAWRV
jgi:metallophosphoesterase superfamily enzyme